MTSMDRTVRENLIEQFRCYLDEAQRIPEPEGEDVFSLFTELAGLKAEIKRESRQVKDALEQFKAVFATLQADNEALSRELDRQRAAERTQRRETLRPLLLELLELRDRLEAGLGSGTARPRPLLDRFCRRQQHLLDALREGQTMSLRRLDRILGDYRVRPVETLGRPLDPHTMRAMEVESRPDRDSGIVTGELRKGFFWENELLRAADVKVNKRDEP